jgi:hypothetical protein
MFEFFFPLIQKNRKVEKGVTVLTAFARLVIIESAEDR